MKVKKKVKAYIGIDPGITGCAALLAPDKIHFHNFESGLEARHVLINWDHEFDLYAVLEKPQNVPGTRGSIAMMKKNHSFGLWEGLLIGLFIRFDAETPQKWQKEVFKIKKRVKGMNTKKMAIDFVREQFPAVKSVVYRMKDEHKADALCMAYFAKMRG